MSGTDVYEPTPEEIRIRCREIRDSWSKEKRRKADKRYPREVPWVVPEVRVLWVGVEEIRDSDAR